VEEQGQPAALVLLGRDQPLERFVLAQSTLPVSR
jgi:hypothetical protein